MEQDEAVAGAHDARAKVDASGAEAKEERKLMEARDITKGQSRNRNEGGADENADMAMESEEDKQHGGTPLVGR